eukprot:g70625.t1
MVATASHPGLAHLSALPITHLDLFGCERITDAGLAHLAALPLQRLDLGGCDDHITDAGLAHLSALPLRHIRLYSCYRITDAGLQHLPPFPSTISILPYAGRLRMLGLSNYLIFLSIPSSQTERKLQRLVWLV